MADFQSWTKQGQRPLGRGAFGEVWLVRTDRGDMLAAKYIQMASMGVSSIPSQVKREIDILKQLSHPNVVRFVTVREEVREDGSAMVVFTEFIDGKDLAACGRLSETIAKGYLRQICSGLNYLHTRSPPVLHRDIKGQNIMVARDGIVKLIDFGLSINIMVASGMTVSEVVTSKYYGCGTPVFMAPELFDVPCQFSVKSDVWALGMTIYQMMAGQPPFADARNDKDLVNMIRTWGAPQLPAGSSQQLADFYACCTAKNPAARKSVRQLLEHGLIG